MEKISRTITRNRTFRGNKHGENIANDYQKPYIKGKKTWRKYREQLPETVHLGKKNMEKISRIITRNRTFRGKNMEKLS